MPANQHGLSIIDLLVTMSILFILAAAGLPHVDQRRFDLNTAQHRITADLRWARARAMVSGAHHRFHSTGAHTYQIERLVKRNDAWALDTTVKRATLPQHIVLATPDEHVELNRRGIIVYGDPAAAVPVQWTITDSMFSASRTLTLYPSGQIHAEG